MLPPEPGRSIGTMVKGFDGSGGALGLIDATSKVSGAGDCAWRADDAAPLASVITTPSLSAIFVMGFMGILARQRTAQAATRFRGPRNLINFPVSLRNVDGAAIWRRWRWRRWRTDV